jgi:hypothetical protein
LKKSGHNLDSGAEASAKPDWNSAEDLREPFPANQSHREQLRNKTTSPSPVIFGSLPPSALRRNIDATELSDQRGRPSPAFGGKGQRCSAVSPDRPFVHHAAFSYAGWLQSELSGPLISAEKITSTAK